MGRMIDAGKLVNEIIHKYGNGEYGNRLADAIMEINAQPTVDAVPVVRCKDCKHNYHNMIPSGEAEHGCTKCIELPITADFYCAWGEREDAKN